MKKFFSLAGITALLLMTVQSAIAAGGLQLTTSDPDIVLTPFPELEIQPLTPEEEDDLVLEFAPYFPELFEPEDNGGGIELESLDPKDILTCSIDSDTLVLEGDNSITMECELSELAVKSISAVFPGTLTTKEEVAPANPVTDLFLAQNLPAGPFTRTWDGKTSVDLDAAPGEYTFVVAATADNALPDFSLQHFSVVETEEEMMEEEPTEEEVMEEEVMEEEEMMEGEECAGFPDIMADDPDCEAVEYVQDLGAMTGTGTGDFDPDSRLQRDQIAKIVLETFGLFDDSADYCDGTAAFPDTGEEQWSYQYICRAKDLGVVTGYEAGPDAGNYVPAQLVNRVEFLAIILRNLSEEMPASGANYDDVEDGQWFTDYARFSFNNALFEGTLLYPTNTVTRREVAQVLYQLHTLGFI